MTIKVHELAKELNLNSKELVEKIHNMGIEAKSHMSVLSDIEATAVKNTVLRSKGATETKIVKVAPKKVESGQDFEEPRVVVKASVVPQQSPQQKTAKPQHGAGEDRTHSHKPPMGKPVISRELDQRTQKPPMGRPVAPSDLESRTVPKPQAATPKYTNQEARPHQPKPVQEGDRPASRPAQTGDRPAQRPAQTGDRPAQRPAQTGDRPPYRPSGDRPAQTGGRPPYKPSGDRPAQSGNRPPYKPSGDRPAQTGDRPPYRPSGDRPAQTGDRPPYRPSRDRPAQTGDRPPYRPSGDRPAQNRDRPAQTGDRPPYRPSGDRPPYRQDSNRPPYRGNDNKPEIKTPIIAKPVGIDKRTDKEKERDKFAKLEKGKTKKPNFVRSLEKAAKPKKHMSRPKLEEEPELNIEELPEGTIIVNVPITVAGFCEQAEITTTSVIMKLMKLGIMANINQSIDEDTVLVLAEELGINVVIGRVSEDVVEEGIETFEDKETELKFRPPIITVMGHVDHGKTSLLDAIRKTNVTESESGGITQHIGASEVLINNHKIVFLDTPGHEAFTAMRARGAHVTDIAVLVVAADDSVKPQTVESISHAKAAGVPVIVAVNKMDKPAADLDKVKKDLSTHGILVEEWGGDTICVPVSAKTGEGIVTLLEMILLQAEILELKANPNRLASGTVIEARIDKARGTVATLLVLNGTLHSGDSIVAGTSSGKIKLMVNHLGETIKKAGPATAVEILGLSDVPEAGDVFNAVKEDKMAREIAESRKFKLREEVFARNSSTTLEQLFSQLQEGEVKELNLIIKGDVQGSVGALESSLEKMKNENVRVKVLHSGVGTVTESDVMLASTSGAIIIGFNVRPSTAVSQIAEREGVEIRTYRVIYNVIDEIEAAIKGMLDPIFKEVILGKVEIRETFKVPGIGLIAGAYVTEGKVVRNAEIRLLRDGIVIHEGKISSLKRFKDDAKEVAKGFECGIGIEKFNDVKEGDLIECFQMEEIERK